MPVPARPRRRAPIAAAALLSAALAAAVGCSTPDPEPRPGVTVLANFTLIDGTDAEPLPHAAMVIDQGRISWVGPATELASHASETPTDLGGAFVMPGLVNLHAHIGNTIDFTQEAANHTTGSVERDLRLLASYGITSVLSMGTDQDVVFPIRDRQRAGRPAEARLYTAGQGLMFAGGYGGLAGVNVPVATPEAARKAVAAQAAKGVDVIKLWLDDELGTLPKMPAAISQAVIDAAHEHHLKAVAHVFYLEDARRLVDQGIDGFVHSVRDAPLDQALIDKMKAEDVWQVAGTLSREAAMFAYGATPPFASDPFFTRGVSATTLELITSPERQRAVASTPNFSRYPPFLETAKANLKRQAAAGVRIGYGTDTGPPGRFAGYFEHWELALMVEAGLTPRQTIAAATRDAAAFLGAADLGTLEASKWADLVVLDADPLADILNTRTIRMVYVAGQEVPAVTLDAGRSGL
jgi:imidazolonepropionase-like amidohydrolase